MRTPASLIVVLLTIFMSDFLSGIVHGNPLSPHLYINEQDSLKENQILYNGRVWRNRYYRIREDQFLFSKDYLPGAVTIAGRTFKNIVLRYDIYNDEIMTPSNHGTILQLNKEMVDSFNFKYQNREYSFTKITQDSVRGFHGYVNVLYSGKTSLYVKYIKEIDLLAVERKYDMFYQIHHIYFVKDNIIYPLSSKRELLNIFGDNKLQVKAFIKKNKLVVSKKMPESFIPVFQYCDTLLQ